MTDPSTDGPLKKVKDPLKAEVNFYPALDAMCNFFFLFLFLFFGGAGNFPFPPGRIHPDFLTARYLLDAPIIQSSN